jgi:hypothetical protein
MMKMKELRNSVGWHTPEIPASQRSGRSQFKASLGEKVSETPHLKSISHT